MHSGEEILKSEADIQLLTAQELVNLRKLKDEQSLPNWGLKYSACTGTLMEEEEIKGVLTSYKDILTQKRCSRICDLMQAQWDDTLKAAVTTKLKGKFIQHMGRKIDDKVALSSEESLFLLENGCMEIMNGKTLMSTEEAYNLMLKERLNLEKYQVYSHLSQLGFIVVPHQKELNNQLSSKKTNTEQKQRKRKLLSPISEKSNNKRLTFSGILEGTDSDKTHPTSENHTKSNMEVLMAEAQTYSTNEAKCFEHSKKEICETASNETEIVTKLSPYTGDCNIENKENVTDECQVEDHRSESVTSLSRYGLEEMEIDSQSAEVASEESREVKDSLDAGNNSLSQECHIINSRKERNEDTSEVICYSSSNLNESFSEDSTSNNLCIDDEVTLLVVKKKETTPLAVIDLLSDDEASEEKLEEPADSDDDIKIIKVCNKPLIKDKSAEIPSNLEKIKLKKVQDCKVDASESQSFIPSLQFPDIFRKDLVCVPRPPLNLLPLHVQPNKEVYILDLAKYSDQAEKSFQPPERLWNSYKDMQDYQRARRRHRQSDRYSHFQNRDRRPWQKTFKQNNDSSREHRQTFTQNDFSSQHLANLNHWNLISTGNRLDVNNYGSNHSHNRQSDANYLDSSNSRNGWRHPAAALDQKPNSPIVFGNIYEQRNFGPHPYQNSGTAFSQQILSANSYSTSMFASMFGQSLNFNNPNFRPFQPEGMISPAPFGRQVNDWGWNSVDQFPAPNSRRNDYYHNGLHSRNNSFPCQYRHVNNKTSWNDVRTVVRNENVSSSNNISDVEELPPDINEFLWNFSNISPLVKPGTKHAISDVLTPLRLTRVSQLTDKNSKHNKSLPDEPMLEITYDIYLPGTHFKKSSPCVPKHRVVVVKASDPIPRYSEIAVLKKKWNDGATLQIAVVDNTNIAFCCFNSICLPCVIPFEE